MNKKKSKKATKTEITLHLFGNTIYPFKFDAVISDRIIVFDAPSVYELQIPQGEEFLITVDEIVLSDSTILPGKGYIVVRNLPKLETYNQFTVEILESFGMDLTHRLLVTLLDKQNTSHEKLLGRVKDIESDINEMKQELRRNHDYKGY
jgi:hypothetical protein